MNDHHTTEASARKAARRLGRERVRVIEVQQYLTSLLPWEIPECGFYVEDSTVQRVSLRPWETLVYEGPGYACGRDIT